MVEIDASFPMEVVGIAQCNQGRVSLTLVYVALHSVGILNRIFLWSCSC